MLVVVVADVVVELVVVLDVVVCCCIGGAGTKNGTWLLSVDVPLEKLAVAETVYVTPAPGVLEAGGTA